MKRRIGGIFLALALCLTLLPTAALAADGQPAIQAGLGSIKGYNAENGYNYIYYGVWKDKPIKWRVLDTQSNIGADGALFLLTDECLYPLPGGLFDCYISFNPWNKEDKHLWQGSTLQNWFKKTFYSGAFTDAEQALIPEVTKESSKHEYKTNPNSPYPGTKYQTDALNSEHVFAPSIEEICNANYGFATEPSRTAEPLIADNTWTRYWLRSYNIEKSKAAYVAEGGNPVPPEYEAGAKAAVRPAMNLSTDSNNILFISAAEDGKPAGGLTIIDEYTGSEWKLTLKDSSRSGFTVTKVCASDGYLYLDYKGAVIGENEYISGYLTSENQGNVISHYGRLGKVTDSNGTVKITKSGIPDGYLLYVYNEQYNDDFHTDYAGEVISVDLSSPTSVIDVTANLMHLTTDGKPYVAESTAYTATLTPEKNYMLPESVTVTAGGTELTAGTDYTYDSGTGELTVPAEKVTGALTITANGIKKVWELSVDAGDPTAPDELDFGTVDYGTPISARTVTLKNTGNQPLTVERPELALTTDFEVELGSGYNASEQAELAPGETATFTVRPASGLLLGDYSDFIDISTDNQNACGSLDVSISIQEAIVNISDIHGVTAPVTGETPAATITETKQYTGTVIWSPDDAAFAIGKPYTATITLTPKYGYTLTGVPENFFKVSGASCTNAAGSGVITAEFPAIPTCSGGSYTPTYPVSTPSKTENGSVSVSPKNASKGDTVTITVKPDSGYELETVAATDKNGNDLKLTDKGNGKYTFTMPAGKVEVKATFMEDNSLLNFFYDVPNGAYYYEAVKWAVENGITGGIGNNLFGPDQPCTRAQIVTFLWRAAGSPEPKSTSSFSDVPAGSYYAKAVAWAIENGITTGMTATTFSPDAACTRAQAVTFLARALNAKASGKAEFTDVPVGSYFADAVAWAASNGVTTGIGGGLFGPNNDCTRGQIVTFLWRAYNK